MSENSLEPSADPGRAAMNGAESDGMAAVAQAQTVDVGEETGPGLDRPPAGVDDLCRLNICGPSRSVELAVPVHVPLIDLLPAMVGHLDAKLADAGLEHGGWVLQRLGDPPLREELTVAALGLHDGDTVHLRPRSDQLPPLDFDDLIDGIAVGISGRSDRWRLETFRRLLTGLLAVPLVAALALVIGHHGVLADILAAVAAVILLGLAAAAARAFADRSAAGILAAAAIVYAAVAGAELILLHGHTGGALASHALGTGGVGSHSLGSAGSAPSPSSGSGASSFGSGAPASAPASPGGGGIGGAAPGSFGTGGLAGSRAPGTTAVAALSSGGWSLQRSALLAAAGATAVMAAAVTSAVGGRRPSLTGTTVTAIWLTAVLALAAAFKLSLAGTAGVALALLLPFSGWIPVLSFRLAGMRLDPLPTTPGDLQTDLDPLPGLTLVERTRRADANQNALYCGLAVVAVACLTALGVTPGWSAHVVAIDAAAVLLLQARVLAGARQRLAVILPAIGGLAVLIAVAGLRLPGGAWAGLFGGLVLAGGALFAAELVLPGRRSVPHWGWAGDILQSLAAVALIPLVLWVLNLYHYARIAHL